MNDESRRFQSVHHSSFSVHHSPRERSEATMTNLTEYFRSPPVTAARREPGPVPPVLRWLLDWESWLTLALVMVVFLSVARSIDSAAWVPEMPSVTGVSFLALLAGFVLARIRAPQGVLYLVAIALGFVVVYLLTLRFIDAPGLRSGTEELWSRWGAWIEVVRTGGISSDTMPFVAMVMALAWIAGYLCAWSIFRWQNAWIALVPAGFGLLTNISYQPGQQSMPLVIFLLGAMLLVMRVHIMRKVREWQATGTPYPDFLSLTLLNVTFWVAVGALILAWSLPSAQEVPALKSTWNRVAGPFSSESDLFTRLFSNIDSKKEVPLHGFGDTLPLQGRISLSSRIVAQADFGEGTNMGRPIRAAVYDEYISGGWRAGPRTEVNLGPLEEVPVSTPEKAQYRDRQDIQVNIVTESGTPRRTMLGVGSLRNVSLNARAEVTSTDAIPDVAAFRSRSNLSTGDIYVSTGSVSVASEEKLRGAGTDYPQDIRDRYLQLPSTLPQRVRDQAANLTRDRRTPFEKAKAIEEYLRTFPATVDIRSVPPNRDAVDFFLFEEKKGYADYQASAMVVLLRAVGVPARLAVGYRVDEFDLSVNRFLLRQSHAYAWPEVYFPTYGWVEFSPYGEAPVIVRPVSDGEAGDTAINEEDLLRGFGEPDFGEIPEDFGATGTFTPPTENPLKAYLPLLYILLGIVALGGIAGLGVRFAWERGLAGLDYPSRLWEKTVRLATWLKLGPKPSQTPAEFSRAIRRSLPGTEGIAQVAESYQRSRYGGRHEITTEEEERLEGAWTGLRNRLLKKVFRLK
jgi:transglutaminase-like putative cysteine protease